MFAIRFITLYKNPSQDYNTPIKNLLFEWVNTDLFYYILIIAEYKVNFSDCWLLELRSVNSDFGSYESTLRTNTLTNKLFKHK